MQLGAREGRHFIYPTSDEMVFLLSAHQGELARDFALFQPDLETTMRVLDKKQLLAAAADAGVETPQTWFPEDAADVERAARDADGPLLFKPRTQLFLRNHSKGALVPAEPSRLREAYRTFRAGSVYGPPVAGGMNYLAGPMLQRYYPEAAEGIYSLTGFRDRSGRHLPLLGSVKILQRPRRLGIGLCFESAPVPDVLRVCATRLLDGLGYFGVFELEFIRLGGRYPAHRHEPALLQSDAARRARGLDLPMLAYAAAIGDDHDVSRLTRLASSIGTDRVFCNRIGLGILLGAQRLFGSMTSAEASRWRVPGPAITRLRSSTPIAADDDRGPTLAEGHGTNLRLSAPPARLHADDRAGALTRRMPLRSTQVAIVGAGPYGLSIAAHLKHRRVQLRIFGSPMSFWLQMPASISLKSFAWATNVAVPHRDFTFAEWCRSHGLEDLEPCSMESFAAYGLWVQRALVPEVEDTRVTAVRAARSGFEIELHGGEIVSGSPGRRGDRAGGLRARPRAARRPPGTLVTHSSQHRTYAAFEGKDVAVVGAGASALETATMLHEAGARPLLLVRDASVEFHTRFEPHRSLRERMKAPNSVLGPGRKSWVLEKLPLLLHYLPEARRVRFTSSYLGAAGPWWLADRFKGKVEVRTNTRVTAAEPRGRKLALELSGGGRKETLLFDHAIAGTGFQVDVNRIAVLDGDLRARVRRVERAPSLSADFESSVPGLFFVGASAALSFGPLLRFVAGAAMAAPRVARRIHRSR